MVDESRHEASCPGGGYSSSKSPVDLIAGTVTAVGRFRLKTLCTETMAVVPKTPTVTVLAIA